MTASYDAASGSPLSAWLGAARPATLWAAFAPVLVGTAAAYQAGCFRLLPALAALAGALWIQIGTNFANDLFDFHQGADTDERLGPKRALQAGALTPRSMALATTLAFAIAALFGVYLTYVAGPWVIGIGLFSIASGLAYTGGPFPLAYHGLGDVFVFVFFGLVAVAGAAYVQCRTVPESAWWAAVAVGALSTAILVVNNLRDRHTDAAAGKRTLAVRLGATATRWQYAILVTLALVVPPAWWLLGRVSMTRAVAPIEVGLGLIPVLVAPWAVARIVRVFQDDGGALNRSLGATARLLLVYSILYAVSLVATASPQ